MGRTIRIEYPGALYHVTSRGNERKKIYYDEYDYLKFLSILNDYYERFGILIYCFVLMGNHYHLIMETPYGELQKIMHGINSAYTGHFNRRHQRIGHLFQGRYQALLVDKDSYLLQLSRYIHLNPVRAGIVEKPEDFRWSSYQGFMGKERKEKWVNYDAVLSLLSNNEENARQLYLKYVHEMPAQKIESPLKDTYAQLVLGGEEFIEKIENIIEGKIPLSDSSYHMIIPEEIVNKVAEVMDTEVISIVSLAGKDNPGRKVAIYLMKRFTSLSNNEIGKIFEGMNPSTVSQVYSRFRKELSGNEKLERLVEEICMELNSS